MIKRYFTAFTLCVFIISCNETKDKAVPKKEDGEAAGIKKQDNNNLVYLDTAKNIYNMLGQDWVLAEDAEGLEGMDDNSKFEIPYRSFCLSAGGTYVKDPRNTFDYGNWSYDEATKRISFNNSIARSKDIYRIEKITYNEMILANLAENSAPGLKFIAPGKRFANAADEPFLLENNRWRIRPASNETDAAIHRRLKENIHFFILFYRAVLEKDEKIVSFWGLPSCFKWYGGGIFIKKENELKANWINCFYNREQAMKAYALAGKLMEQKYSWPKGEQNWLKLNLAVLEQMYVKIDEIK